MCVSGLLYMLVVLVIEANRTPMFNLWVHALSLHNSHYPIFQLPHTLHTLGGWTLIAGSRYLVVVHSSGLGGDLLDMKYSLSMVIAY